MRLSKYQSYKSYPIPCPKNVRNPNPKDTQLRDKSLATRYPPHQSKTLETILNI